MVNKWLSTTATTVKCLALLHIIHTRFYEFTETRGESMIPTLSPTRDYVHVSKQYKYGKGVKMGDCIVLRKPHESNRRVCKRITGMPGDIILVDPTSNDHGAFTSFIKIPKGHVWVTGDNLAYSLDSRSYNVVPMGLIVGKIISANDFNEPVRKNGTWFGYRKIESTYNDEIEKPEMI